MKLTMLAGGTGAAKFLRGVVGAVRADAVTAIVNTGDDLTLWGLSICPDLDTITYALAGKLDRNKGWGVIDDTFHCHEAMKRFGHPAYFGLGDEDLALHVLRTARLREGERLSRVTDGVRRAFGIESRILPMSDEPVRTRIRTAAGWLDFQEYFVRERHEPEVLDVVYEGAAQSHPAPQVLEAIRQADAVIVCPSNPVSSIGPILAVPEIEQELLATQARVLAVSPIVGGRTVSGPAGKMMSAKGYEPSCVGVAEVYGSFLDVLVIDNVDAAHAPRLRALGIEPLVTDTMMGTADRELALARDVLRGVP